MSQYYKTKAIENAA